MSAQDNPQTDPLLPESMCTTKLPLPNQPIEIQMADPKKSRKRLNKLLNTHWKARQECYTLDQLIEKQMIKMLSHASDYTGAGEYVKGMDKGNSRLVAYFNVMVELQQYISVKKVILSAA
ncbi:MAG: hypothetical protein Q9168_002358 [Polycauliona sp. 1 TL-2023]